MSKKNNKKKLGYIEIIQYLGGSALVRRRKFKFQRVCSYCKKPIGVKYDYPPREWDGKEPLVTHGICDECRKKLREGVIG